MLFGQTAVKALVVGEFARSIGGGETGHEHRMCRFGLDLAVDAFDYRLAVDGVSKGLAHIEIVEWGVVDVEKDVVGTD